MLEIDRIVKWLGERGDELLGVVFPRVCPVCLRTLVRGEEILCLSCRDEMPVTNLHRQSPNQIMDRVFDLRYRIERATSLFYYNKRDKYVALIHDTKYHGRPSVGKALTARHAQDLRREGFFDGIDLIVSVPLHPFKRLVRGYNQAEVIAEAVSEVTEIPFITPLKASWHSSQTRKSGRQRQLNVRSAYTLSRKHDIPQGAHILLVDDVITTGSTMRSCMAAIAAKVPGVRFSLYSLALTISP